MRRMLLASVALVACSTLFAAPLPAQERPVAAATKPAAGEISITSKSTEAVQVFKKGREYAENVRPAEATEQFKKAVALDPGFALAHAYLGQATPGSEGLKHLEQAASLAQGLPEAERMLIDAMLATRRGDEEKVRGLWKKLATTAPNDWRAHLALGGQLSGERKWDEAIAALKKATELNPKAGTAFNTMGYAYLAMGKKDQAIEAFRRYSAIHPDEPNPQDSLAEALMAAGRFEEAEAAFRKASEISPQFWNASAGVAQAKFLRGDWAGGREALAKAKAAATRPVDKLATEETLAWSQAAEGKTAEALKTIDGVEKAAATGKVDVFQAFAPLDRATLLIDMGKHEEALQQAAMALENAQKAGLPGGVLNNVRRAALAIRIDAESKLGRAADAAKTLALIEEEAKKAPANAELQSMLRFARGAEAMARGEAKAAVPHFSQCHDQDYYCRWQLVMAQEKAGDKAGAEATRKRLLSANARDPIYLYVRSKLSEKAGTAPK